ncbi:MAG TPA: aldehyde dehydrogenase family protein [Terriglobales bacterium]|nr:aldehyde dehydrogenase family protein [Terriglobales bacterium]
MPSEAQCDEQGALLLVAGQWQNGVAAFPVLDKYHGNVIGRAQRASQAQVAAAVAAAAESFVRQPLAPYRRFQILQRASELIESRRRELVATIVAEAGFPIADAENEVTRAVQTFLTSAEEAKRLVGELVPLAGAPGAAHRMGFTLRVPRGVVCGITSFNSPLNMVAHKVAPALAAGNTVVIKPPQATPLSAARLMEILIDAGLPPTHASLVQGPGAEVGAWLAADPRIAFYAFTGSTAVGQGLRQAVGMRPIALELGSLSPTVVCDDADIARAVPRCLNSGFRRAGQACTSIQRLYVQRGIQERFLEALLAAARQLKVGDPHDPATAVGPMISEAEARRAEEWVEAAVAAGARRLCGGARRGALLPPTILADVPAGERVICEEIFAPVMSVLPFDDLGRVIADMNALPYGLAAGIFTRRIDRAMDLARKLRVAVVHINESSSSRVDMMPFGGVKASGIGWEGPKYAMREMTEERLITLSLSEEEAT